MAVKEGSIREKRKVSNGMKLKYWIFRYGILKRLKRGIRISIVPSWKCNLKCDYCILKTSGKLKYPQNSQKIKYIDYWKEYIKTFPMKIREITLAGGEPSLLPYFAEFTNWLLLQGYFVVIFTNLTNKNIMRISPSVRLLIIATCHSCYDIKKFIDNYKAVSQKYRINVIEIGNRRLSFSIKKPLSHEKEAKVIKKNYLKVGPNGIIYRNCFDRNESFK